MHLVQLDEVVELLLSQQVEYVLPIVVELAHGALAEVVTPERYSRQRRQRLNLVDILKVLYQVRREHERLEVNEYVANILNFLYLVSLKVKLLKIYIILQVLNLLDPIVVQKQFLQIATIL